MSFFTRLETKLAAWEAASRRMATSTKELALVISPVECCNSYECRVVENGVIRKMTAWEELKHDCKAEAGGYSD